MYIVLIKATLALTLSTHVLHKQRVCLRKNKISYM